MNTSLNGDTDWRRVDKVVAKGIQIEGLTDRGEDKLYNIVSDRMIGEALSINNRRLLRITIIT